MILWAIEPAEKWSELSIKGVLRIHPDKDFLPPYEWIRAQMTARIGQAPADGLFPFRCYRKWEGKEGADLRTFRRHWPAGKSMVRIEFDCPDQMVLLANEELWIYVINHWYLPKSTADGDAFDRRFPDHPYPTYLVQEHPDPKFQEEVRQSWERIFDLDWEDPEFTSDKAQASILGFVWEIKSEWVRDRRFFTGCSRNG